MAIQMRVWDAVMIEQDDSGLFVTTQDTTYFNASNTAHRMRIAVPDRFFDVVSEARKMGKRLRVYYKTAEGAATAELIEMV